MTNKHRTTFNLCLVFCFILSMGAHFTGILWHEVTCAVAMTLSILHLYRNHAWYFASLRGRYGWGRWASTFTNTLLLIDLAVLLGTSIPLSHYIFVSLPLPFESSFQMRSFHSFAAYWLIALMGLHLGLHFESLKSTAFKYIGNTRCATLFSWTVILLGIACWVDREMFNKLFLGYSFDFWDPSGPLIFLFASYLMIALGIGHRHPWIYSHESEKRFFAHWSHPIKKLPSSRIERREFAQRLKAYSNVWFFSRVVRNSTSGQWRSVVWRL